MALVHPGAQTFGQQLPRSANSLSLPAVRCPASWSTFFPSSTSRPRLPPSALGQRGRPPDRVASWDPNCQRSRALPARPEGLAERSPIISSHVYQTCCPVSRPLVQKSRHFLGGVGRDVQLVNIMRHMPRGRLHSRSRWHALKGRGWRGNAVSPGGPDSSAIGVPDGHRRHRASLDGQILGGEPFSASRIVCTRHGPIRDAPRHSRFSPGYSKQGRSVERALCRGGGMPPVPPAPR